MDFESHKEVVLPPDKTKKKPSRDKGDGDLPAPKSAEIHLSKKEAYARKYSSDDTAREGWLVPSLTVREITLSSDESKSHGAAAWLRPGEAGEKLEIRPEIENFGVKVLDEDSTADFPILPTGEVQPPKTQDVAEDEVPQDVKIPQDVKVPQDSAPEIAEDSDLEAEPAVVPALNQSAKKASEKPRKRGQRKAKTTKKATGQKPYRDFIIAYEGVFIGHYRCEKRITNRTAFQRVARQLESALTTFDAENLELYRPVLLKITIPDALSECSDGTFEWFAG